MRALKWLITLVIFGFIAYAVLTSYRNWIVTEPMPRPTLAWGDVRLNVLNASSDEGAGKDVREYLARKGFDVYDERLDNLIRPRTLIFDRRDPGLKYARELSNAVMVPARKLGPLTVEPRQVPEIDVRIDSLLYLEATVVLGMDYRTFFPVNPRPF